MLSGNCSCGSVILHLFLPSKLDTYASRACDCDFCKERNIAYLSDPEGKLVIHSNHKLQQLHQGSEQASFLECQKCNDVVAVICEFGNLNKGAINATLLKDFEQTKKPQIVSPKALSAENKLNRWNSLWLTVEIDYATNM